MGAVATKAGADLRRRRLQTAVLGTVLFLASAAATLALSLLIESHAPFDRAFERANGAHLVIDFDPAVTDAALAATATAGPVTAAAGPWPVSSAGFHSWTGAVIGGRAVSGRPQPDASIDHVTINAGRWWQAPGEVVVSQDTATILGIGVGDALPVYPPSTPGSKQRVESGGRVELAPSGTRETASPVMTLTVVGVAASVSTPDVAAWMHPSDVAAIDPSTPPAHQMLYRADPAATAADLSAAVAAIEADLPAGGVVATLPYLETKASAQDVADLYVPVLLAFSIFALLAAAFTIANVVSGVVLTSYRDIGIMKAVGYTPRQVSAILLAQILVPVVAGTVAGVVVGTIASRPTVERTAQSFGLPASFAVSIPAVVGVLAACLLVALGAALGPALVAGRLSAVGAITRGTAPSTRAGGGRLRRLGLRLPAPVPVRLGLAAGVAHPVRATMTLGAVIVGVAAVVFAIGLNASLVRVIGQIDRTAASPVRVELTDTAANTSDITAAIASGATTDRFVTIGQVDVAARGLGQAPFVGYQGDTTWLGYELIRGRWFTGPGEAVAPTAVFTDTGLAIGDTLELTGSGGTAELRLVGEILDMGDESDDGLVVRGTWEDLVAIQPAAQPSRWEVRPVADATSQAAAAAIREATAGLAAVYTIHEDTSDEEFLLFLSVITFMGAVLVAISLGGVFNTVLLETRQRTREMAVLKAVGLTPAQVVVMIVASVVPIGLVAGLVGVPLGFVFQRAVLSYIGQTAGRTGIPDSTFDVFPPPVAIGLALAGLAIAAMGAYLPAQRAARARIAPVLQAE